MKKPKKNPPKPEKKPLFSLGFSKPKPKPDKDKDKEWEELIWMDEILDDDDD